MKQDSRRRDAVFLKTRHPRYWGMGQDYRMDMRISNTVHVTMKHFSKAILKRHGCLGPVGSGTAPLSP
jgi:hypothetical protein